MTDNPPPDDPESREQPADGSETGAGAGVRDVPPSRPKRGRAPRTRTQRALVLAGWAIIVLLLGGAAWVLVTGLLARSRLDEVRSDLGALRRAAAAGQADQADQLVRRIAAHAHSAHALTSGPAWGAAAAVPGLGTPALTTRTLARETDVLSARVLPAVSHLTRDFETRPATGTALSGADVPLDRIANAAPLLATASHATHDALQAVRSAPSSWFSPVGDARTDVINQLSTIDDQLGGIDQTVQIMLPMLGRTHPQRYFLGFLNEAESRGVGGIPGAFAIVEADRGRLTFERFGSDDDLRGVRASGVDLGSEYNARYKQDDPTGVIQNSDISPNFPDAARIWAGMWEKKSGEHIDGALAIDPTALSYLLKVTGPAHLRNGTVATAANIVALTQQKQYALYPRVSSADQRLRKNYLIDVAMGVARRITSSRNAQGLAKAMSQAAGERRLLVWSADETVEKRLTAAGWAGALDPPRGAPVSGFVINNASGGKLDYYVHRSMSYTRTGCDAAGRTYATFTVRNDAPAHGLPPYVTTRADQPPRGTKAGDEHLLITYYASAGSQFSAATLDNEPIILATTPEHGLLTATVDLELPVGESRTIAITLTGPSATAGAYLVRQPGVNPAHVVVNQPDCGG